MALIVYTPDPSGLLQAINDGIKSGSVITWSVDADGDYTHTPAQWARKAWMRPSVEAGRITFKILTPKEATMSKEVYGVYHGRFTEMLLTHFDLKFTNATATALPAHGDIL
jgi:hypothetical protein